MDENTALEVFGLVCRVISAIAEDIDARSERGALNGTVTDASGQVYHLTAVNVFVRAPGEDPNDILNANTKIKLNSIGG